MKRLKKTISILIIFISSFELAFAATIQTVGRFPASSEDVLISEIETFQKELSDYREIIFGRKINTCKKEETHLNNVNDESFEAEEEPEALSKINYNFYDSSEDDFFNFLSNVQKNSDKNNPFDLYLNEEPERQEEEKKDSCIKEELGLFQKYVSQTMVRSYSKTVCSGGNHSFGCREKKVKVSEKKAYKKQKSFSLNDKSIVKLRNLANQNLKSLNTFIFDTNIELEQRRAILVQYLDNVLLPLRDYIVATHKYDGNDEDSNIIFDELTPIIPEEFVPSQSELENEDQQIAQEAFFKYYLITKGPMGELSPFGLKAQEVDNGYRLVFSPSSVLPRDAATLLKVPSAVNFNMAMKWLTLQMMLSQIYHYREAAGTTVSTIKVPNSCGNHFHGTFKNDLDFNILDMDPNARNSFLDGGREMFLYRMLKNTGLSMGYGNDVNQAYVDYYLRNVNRDPTKKGFSEMRPFEVWHINNSLISSKANNFKLIVDDFFHFDQTLNSKLPYAFQKFKKRQGLPFFGEHKTYKSVELFKKMVSPLESSNPPSFKDNSGEIIEIDTAKNNISTYLAEYMQRNKIKHPSDIFPKELSKKMGNLKISFPSIYSRKELRTWGYNQLAKVFDEKISEDLDKNDSFYKIIIKSCQDAFEYNQYTVESSPIACSLLRSDPKKHTLKIFDKLKPFLNEDSLIPYSEQFYKTYRPYHRLFNEFWVNFRDIEGIIPAALPSERRFLIDQLYEGNPWAKLRIGYLLASHELDLFADNASTKKGRKNILELKKQVEEASNELQINKTFSLGMANRALASKPKLKKKIILDSLKEIDEQNLHIFKEKRSNSNDKFYYQVFEDLAAETMIAGYTAKVKAHDFSANSDQVKEEIDQFQASAYGEYSKFLMSIYHSKSLEQQISLIENSDLGFEIDTNQTKLLFLKTDSHYKTIIMEEIAREAALNKANIVQEELDTFCGLDPSKHEEMKAIYLSTTKAQNLLNQNRGLPKIPPAQMKLLEKTMKKMGTSELQTIMLGIGGAVLSLGALGLAATGFGLIFLAAGLTGLAMQAALIPLEINIKKEFNRLKEVVSTMENLGQADYQQSKEFNRSNFWIGLEVAFLLPMIGLVGKTTRIGMRSTKMFFSPLKSATKGKGAWKQNLKQRYNHAAKAKEQLEGINSLELLKLASRSKDIEKKVVYEVREDLGKIRSLFENGKLETRHMFFRVNNLVKSIPARFNNYAKNTFTDASEIFAKTSVEDANMALAKVLTEDILDNPKQLKSILVTLNKKNKKAAKKANIAKAEGRSLTKEEVLSLRIEKNFKTLSNKLDSVSKENLENFIYKNIDDLNDFFVEKRFFGKNLVGEIIAVGSPHKVLVASRNVPVLGYRYFLVNQLFNARSRVVYEVHMLSARELIGSSMQAGKQTAHLAYSNFRNTMLYSGEKDLVSSVKKLEKGIIKKIEEGNRAILSKDGKVNRMLTVLESKNRSLESILFTPISSSEKVLSDLLWRSKGMQEILLKDIDQAAYRAVKKLSGYKGMDDFQRYLNAFKMLILQRKAGVLNVI